MLEGLSWGDYEENVHCGRHAKEILCVVVPPCWTRQEHENPKLVSYKVVWDKGRAESALSFSEYCTPIVSPDC